MAEIALEKFPQSTKMTTQNDDLLKQIVLEMLNLGKSIVASNKLLIDEVGTTNAKGDKSIQMDIKIESVLIDYIKSKNLPADIFSEEIGTIKFHPEPKYMSAFDPLEGSTNYKVVKNIYPYGLLVAIYQGTKPLLKDVIVSGAIEFTQDLAWIYSEGQTFTLNGDPIVLKTDWAITRSTPIFLDLYYKEGYEFYRPLAQKLFIRNSGSTIGNLSYLLENISTGLGGVCMRPEEIGAIYSLIKGVGGQVVDHLGQDLGESDFDQHMTYQILGGCPKIIDYVLDQLKDGS